jgi:hypothetical protein
MAARIRLGLVASIVVAAGLTTGCNLLSLPFFLFGPEPSVPAKMQELGGKDKRHEVSVVVLTYAGPETRPEFIKVDRDLAARIATEMRTAFEYNQKHVKVVSSSKVEKFKQDNPNWQTMEPAEIGNHFKADYVIYVELDNDSLSLYQRGSGQVVFRGHAEGKVSLINVRDPEDGSKHQEFSYTYPSDANAIEASETTPVLFKQKFLDYVAKKITWCFTSHPTRDGYVEE